MSTNFFNPRYEARVRYTEKGAAATLSHYLHQHLSEDLVVICIGTDRCIGDALGPLIGTLLKNKNFPYPLYGTLEEPIHAVNLLESIESIQSLHPNGFYIAIDACLGAENLIGNIHIKKGPIFPGKGVGKKLPGIGHLSIVGIIDKISHDDCFSIHNIRLSLVMNMAQVVVDGFMGAVEGLVVRG